MNNRYPYYVQAADDEHQLVQDGIVHAHSKSRNVLSRIRDCLNAAVPLEGQVVQRRPLQRTPRGDTGVVQAVAYDATCGFWVLLVRRVDDTLDSWRVDIDDASVDYVVGDPSHLHGNTPGDKVPL